MKAEQLCLGCVGESPRALHCPVRAVPTIFRVYGRCVGRRKLLHGYGRGSGWGFGRKETTVLPKATKIIKLAFCIIVSLLGMLVVADKRSKQALLNSLGLEISVFQYGPRSIVRCSNWIGRRRLILFRDQDIPECI